MKMRATHVINIRRRKIQLCQAFQVWKLLLVPAVNQRPLFIIANAGIHHHVTLWRAQYH